MSDDTAGAVAAGATADVDEKLLGKVRKQVEFYFSDSNYPKDKYLRELAAKDTDSWVPIEELLRFNRLKALTTDVAVVAKAMADSDVVQLNKDGLSVRRLAPLPDKDDSMYRSIYVKGMPTRVTIEEVSDLFEKFGKVKSVRLRYYRDKTPKGSAFVEFSSPAEAEAACAAKNEMDGKELLVMMKQAYFDTKKAQRIAQREEKKRKAKEEAGAAAAAADGADGDDAAIEYTKGLILAFNGCGPGATREDVRAACEPFGKVMYIDFTKDAADGFVRFEDAEAASKAAKGLSEAGLQLGGQAVTVKLLEGEAEEQYWKRVSSMRAEKFAGSKGKGGKRGRGGRGGRGGKRGGKRGD